MPIPAFDGITNLLPPFLGSIANPADYSPYECSMVDVAQRMGGSTERKEILMGLLDLRAELRRHAVEGVQWLDGSFVENIEMIEKRAPKDIDVVTYATDDVSPLQGTPLLSRSHIKQTYRVDHFLIPPPKNAVIVVRTVAYWNAIFSHRRDGLWKGMLQVSLSQDAADDDAAKSILGGSQ